MTDEDPHKRALDAIEKEILELESSDEDSLPASKVKTNDKESETSSRDSDDKTKKVDEFGYEDDYESELIEDGTVE